jgi:CRISPR/Cas system CMR subunit Cmr4 (Cas7 group RAMP superfamily)
MRTTPIATVWRLVLEADTPLSIATGRGDGERDTVLASDANGLPCIPASSLAGVLRALVRGACPALEESLFGRLAATDTERGSMSRLELSHAHLHDSHDRPVTGLRESIDDPLLKPLLHRRNAQRQRVRIDHRGTADDRGLFDRSVLPAGHRFTVEWLLWSHDADPVEARVLDALLAEGWLRVGGLTRSGLGLLRCVRGRWRRFDLRLPADLAAWASLPHDLAESADAVLTQHWAPPRAEPLGELRRLRLRLRPEGGFRFGGGTQSLGGNGQVHPNADWAASERRVVWHDGRGRLAEAPKALIPATGVKGALAHRVAFHAHRLAGEWASTERLRAYDKARDCASVRRLFGSAGNERDDAGARAGVLGFADQWLVVAAAAGARGAPAGAVTAQVRMHNHIDRYTGGVREGLLYGSEDLHASDPATPLLTLEITLDERRWRAGGGGDADLHALALAVADLCEGRLALGADDAAGLGRFRGTAAWDGGFAWPAASDRATTAPHVQEHTHA